VTFARTTPSKIGEYNTFPYTTVDLYVPAGSVAAYKAADNWKNFKQILPIPQNGK
jgi:hypothetical protein